MKLQGAYYKYILMSLFPQILRNKEIYKNSLLKNWEFQGNRVDSTWLGYASTLLPL